MIFKVHSNGKLKINEDIFPNFLKYRQLKSRDLEAGGVLLGRFLEGSEDIIIDLITEPMPNDIRKRYFFQKHLLDHQSIVDEVWKESDGTCNYLGEWHTHPEIHPNPSSHDLREWKKVLKYTQCDSNFLFFFIIGTKSIGVWVGNRTNLKLEKLKVWNQ